MTPLARHRARQSSRARRTLQVAGAAFTLTVAFIASPDARAQRPAGTSWDGVYTSPQAVAGKTAYEQHCSSCHMSDLSGGGSFGLEDAPPLKAADFMDGRDLANVFSFIKSSMPADSPGALDDTSYAEILAYLLQQNGYPAGTVQLQPNLAELRRIQIVSRRP